MRKVTHARKRNPWADRDELLHRYRGPRRNHLRQLLWLSLMGFERGGGSNFGFLHWLASSPLHHSRTTVRVCHCLPPSSVANPITLLLVFRKPSSAVFVLLTLFSAMSHVSGCDRTISSVGNISLPFWKMAVRQHATCSRLKSTLLYPLSFTKHK